MTFHKPVPYLSKHGTSCRQRQGNEQGHCNSRCPTVFVGCVVAPNQAGSHHGGQAVKQCKGQYLGKVNVCAVPAQRSGYLPDRNAMFLSDLVKQSLHASIPFGSVLLARIRASQTKVSISVANRKVFRELSVRTEMASANRVTWRFLPAICSRNYVHRAGHTRRHPERIPSQSQRVPESSFPNLSSRHNWC